MKDVRPTLLSLSITMKMFSWTKWGGGDHSLITHTDKEEEEWYCQVCGEEQNKVLPSYMIPVDYDQRDYVRVCASCKAKGFHEHSDILWDLLKLIKGI